MKFKQIGAAVLIAALSFSAGKFLGSPAQVSNSSQEKKEQQVQTDVKTVIKKKETVKPDGTKETETETVIDKKTDSNTNTEKKTDSAVAKRPNYKVHAIYFPKINNVQDQNIVFDIQKRMFAETYIGLAVSTQKTIGVSLSIGF